MEMTIDDIKALIAADESRTLELKKTTGELKDGMHSACAFLNTEGGSVLRRRDWRFLDSRLRKQLNVRFLKLLPD